jgi:hypothetical protein
MTVGPCPECGVEDALGRHAGDCAHAIEIGLPRLAEGEDPIDPRDVEIEEHTIDLDGPDDEEAPPPLHPGITDRPGAIERHPDAGLYTSLWIAYRGVDQPGGFDAIVFGSELDALRHAVREGYNVHPLELGRSLREQVP